MVYRAASGRARRRITPHGRLHAPLSSQSSRVDSTLRCRLSLHGSTPRSAVVSVFMGRLHAPLSSQSSWVDSTLRCRLSLHGSTPRSAVVSVARGVTGTRLRRRLIRPTSQTDDGALLGAAP